MLFKGKFLKKVISDDLRRKPEIQSRCDRSSENYKVHIVVVTTVSKYYIYYIYVIWKKRSSKGGNQWRIKRLESSSFPILIEEAEIKSHHQLQTRYAVDERIGMYPKKLTVNLNR